MIPHCLIVVIGDVALAVATSELREQRQNGLRCVEPLDDVPDSPYESVAL